MYAEGAIGDSGLIDGDGNPTFIDVSTAIDEPEFFFVNGPSFYIDALNISYKFEDPDNPGSYIELPGYSVTTFMAPTSSTPISEPRFNEVALGGSGWQGFIPPSVPSGYVPTPELAQNINDAHIIPYVEHLTSGTRQRSYEYIFYYDFVGSSGSGTSTTWLKIVDGYASTAWDGSDKYTISDVHFNDTNKLTHLKLTSEDGNFAVYYNGKYSYNVDPAETI
jgi:hypothetical protein